MPRPFGYKMSEETKRKISTANIGKKRTLKQKQNIFTGKIKGKKWWINMSPETRTRLCNRFKGQRSHGWKGGKTTEQGYVHIYRPEHPTAHIRKGYVLEHRYIIEKQIGKILEKGTQVHHLNEDRADNRLNNLVVFKNRKYHKAFHNFMQCLKNGGIIYYSGPTLNYSLKNTTKTP